MDMQEKDIIVIKDISEAFHLLLRGKYPEEIVYEGASEEIAGLANYTNKLILQLKELYAYALCLGRGDLDIERPGKMNFLAAGLKELHSKLIHLTWQAQQISNGDYGQRVDFMGDFSEAFNSMVKKLEKREKQLKEEIAERKRAEDELRRKNQLIMDSISYASMIQRTLLPDIRAMQKKTPNIFALWKPRDMVGGDFYWFVPLDKGFIIAVIDCTGHGVPGAFMTIAVHQILKGIMDEVKDCDPADILNLLNKNINESFYNEYGREHSHFGLDMGICRVDYTNRVLEYAGAKMPLFHVRKGEVNVLRGSKKSIGYNYSKAATRKKKSHTYESLRLSYEAGDRFFMTSDGYIDQNGSQDIYPFGIDNLRKTLSQASDYGFESQEALLMKALEEYMGNEEQRDDITLVGFELK
jgi:sigma-B regulation protein RsbU (phosphoserine phosphatase)